MKRTKRLLIIACVLSLALLLTTSVLVSADEPEFASAEIARVIVLGVEYTWEGSYSGYSTWNLNTADGTFTSGDGGYGVWRRSRGQLGVSYANGCQPLYRGRLQYQWYWTGTMKCRDGSGGRGTWNATYPARTTDVISSDLTSSGEAK